MLDSPPLFARRLLVAAIALLLGALNACGDDTPEAQLLSEGSGTANAAPLWPLAEGRVWGPDARPLLAGHRQTSEGRVLSVDLNLVLGDPRYTAKRTLELLQAKNGDLIGLEPHGPRYLLVPRTVRVGKKWRVVVPFPNHAFSAVTALHSDIVYGDGAWTMEVTSRDVEEGPWGKRIVWTIAIVGPQVPHTLAPGEDDKVVNHKGAYGMEFDYPLAKVPKWGNTLKFVEGVGPTVLCAGPLGERLRSAGPPTPAAAGAGWSTGGGGTPAHLLPPPLPEPLAGASPQPAPTLAMKALGQGPLDVPFDGVFYPGTARHTGADAERAAGFADEILLFGTRFSPNGWHDPNGQLITDWQGGPVTVQLAIDAKTMALAPLAKLAPEVTTPLPGQVPEAHPFVLPDGQRWRRQDGQVGDAYAAGGVLRHAITAEAPLLREGRLLALSCGFEKAVFAQPTTRGAGRLAGCALYAFENPDQVTTVAWQGAKNEYAINAFQVWRHAVAPPPFLGSLPPTLTDEQGSAQARRSELPFARAWGDQLAYVSIDAPATASQGAPTVGAQWMDLAGNVQRRELLQLWHPALSTRAETQVATDVTPQGELHVVHLHPDGLEVELRGRLALPAGHRAIHAIEVSPGRFVVLTEANPEGAAGKPIQAPYDSNISMFGVQPALSVHGQRLYAFAVEAPLPAKRVIARSWLLRRPTVGAAGHLLRICVPPAPAAAPAAAVTVDRLWIAGRTVDLPAANDSDGCRYAAANAAEIAGSALAEGTPVAVHVVGHGWVEHRLPPLAAPMPSAAPWGPLPGGWRRSAGALTAPLGAEVLPAPLRVPGLHPGCMASNWVLYSHCLLHVAGNAAGLPDPAGRGLFVQALGPQATQAGPLSLCPQGGCLDPLALATAPAGYNPTESTWVLLGARAVTPLWASSLGQAKLPDGSPAMPALPAPVSLAPFPWIGDAKKRQGSRVVGPIPGPGGSRWWSAGPPIAAWVREAKGKLRSGPLPAGSDALWSVDDERIFWEPGLITTEAATLATGNCAPEPEQCNGADDDCDGAIDESEPTHKLCDDSHGANTCVAGVCALGKCTAGHADCNADTVDGCETALGSPTNCLACGDACPSYGASNCAADGCTKALLAGVGYYGQRPWRRFANGDVLDGLNAQAGGAAVLAGGPTHVCTLSAQGSLTCTCLASGGDDCSGATLAPASLPVLDRLWAGDRSTCVRVASSGAVWCWGKVAQEASLGVEQYSPREFPALNGASAIAFGGLQAQGAYAQVASKVVNFGAKAVGASIHSYVAELTGLPPVAAVYAGSGYALFATQEGFYGLGALGQFPALGGPSKLVWSTPERAPALDGALAIVTGFENVPCKVEPNRVRCAVKPGSPWLKTLYPFDGPAAIIENFLDIPGAFQQGVGLANTLCLVRNDISATVLCRGGATFP